MTLLPQPLFFCRMGFNIVEAPFNFFLTDSNAMFRWTIKQLVFLSFMILNILRNIFWFFNPYLFTCIFILILIYIFLLFDFFTLTHPISYKYYDLIKVGCKRSWLLDTSAVDVKG